MKINDYVIIMFDKDSIRGTKIIKIKNTTIGNEIWGYWHNLLNKKLKLHFFYENKKIGNGGMRLATIKEKNLIKKLDEMIFAEAL